MKFCPCLPQNLQSFAVLMRYPKILKIEVNHTFRCVYFSTIQISFSDLKSLVYTLYFSVKRKSIFYAPGLKGPPGASSVWIVRPFVCPFVRP